MQFSYEQLTTIFMCPLWQQVINEGNSPSLQFIIMTKKSVCRAMRIIAWQPLPLQCSTYSYNLDQHTLSHDHSVYKLTSSLFDNRTIVVQIPVHSYLEQVISMVSVRPIPVTDLSQGRHVEWSRALNTCGRCIVREGWGIVTNMTSLQPNSIPKTTLQLRYSNVNGGNPLTCTPHAPSGINPLHQKTVGPL